MKRLIAALMHCCVCGCASLGATAGQPRRSDAGTQSHSGAPAANQPNLADRNFARAAAAGGLAEVELGRLADHNGQSQDTRQFGQRMVNDHSKANEQLKELAAAANIPCRTHRVPKTRQYGSASTRCRETLSTVTISEAR